MSRMAGWLAAAVLLGGCSANPGTDDPCAGIDPVPEGESLDIGVQTRSREARCEKLQQAGETGTD
ncbi:MAG: hypothetical protein AAFX58_00205 [Pseudomonadota bacterium]